ncbi:ferrous iron transport protein A [Rhodoferax sp. U2-2l]|uniref:FeoA family protein n=1 Tax=Rhodoferax sp. U2-2l TaxID=2884000 RepID=UPI001D0A63D3|nr:FeoA family protein [Rhodoferax sp. U2-2l]MCB8746463.1 ferrous iron transport protein A [Rhodoferax sp. U2-2l]
MSNLSELKVGERARVLGFGDSTGAYRRKLLSMGIMPGVEIHVVRVAPMGDPVEVRLRGFSLTLRKDEALNLQVEKLA